MKPAAASGTCGACLGSFAVEPGPVVTRHGWVEVGGVRSVGSYDNVAHDGSCFGAGRAPLEVSPDCTRDHLARVLRPRKNFLDAALAAAPADATGAWIALARAELALLDPAVERSEEALRGWAPRPLGPPVRRGPQVHLRNAEHPERFAACGKRLKAYANSRPLPTTSLAAEVTCPMCRELIPGPEGASPAPEVEDERRLR